MRLNEAEGWLERAAHNGNGEKFGQMLYPMSERREVVYMVLDTTLDYMTTASQYGTMEPLTLGGIVLGRVVRDSSGVTMVFAPIVPQKLAEAIAEAYRASCKDNGREQAVEIVHAPLDLSQSTT